MDLFYGIILVLAGILMLSGLFWLIRSGNADSLRALMVIIAAILMTITFLLYIGISLALVGYGTFMILGR